MEAPILMETQELVGNVGVTVRVKLHLTAVTIPVHDRPSTLSTVKINEGGG